MSEPLIIDKWLDQTYELLTHKIEVVAKRTGDIIPYTTIDGHFDDKSASGNSKGISWWTNGFYAAILWLMFNEIGDVFYKNKARKIGDKLSICFNQYYNLDNDCGFMWLTSDVTDFRLTKHPECRKRALHAANILAGRFNPNGNFLRAWNDTLKEENTTGSNSGWVIIDSLMNLPLLFWASKETKDPRFSQIAERHASTTLDNFLRRDGSVNHIVEFNPISGHFEKSYGGQGFSNGSSWTKGQAWGIYGFFLVYYYTWDSKYLEAAKRIGRYFINHLPADYLVPVDFLQPEDAHFEDSSAATIAACGLIEISRLCDDEEKELFLNAGVKLLKNLTALRCNFSERSDNIVEKCSASYHEATHHYPIIYADYFLFEAILKLKGTEFRIW